MTVSALAKHFALSTACLLLLAPGSLAEADTAPKVTDDSVHQAIEVIDGMAQKKLDENEGVGLSIAVVHKDKVVFAKGFGLRVIGKPEKVDADTVFQLASVSKPIGATVVDSLIGDGKITWDSKICDLDPGFQMPDAWVTRALTIRDLYAHRSGLPDHAGDLLEDMGYDRAQVLHRLRFQKGTSSFRAHYAYTNFGMTEAAVAAAKAYGLSWEDASQQRLYTPAGMKSTSSRYSDFVARSDKALGHVLEDGKWVQKYNREPDAESPAGGVSSSANDMAQWMRLQLNNGKLDGKQIVPEQPLLESRHPQMLTGFSPIDKLPGFYGLGINVGYDEHGQLVLSHSGAFDMGAATCIRFIPSQHLGIIVLTNCYPNGLAEGLAATFFDYAMYGKSMHEWFPLYKKVLTAAVAPDLEFNHYQPPASPSKALSNAAYTGTYTNDYYGDIVVAESKGGLLMSYGPNRTVSPMTHYDRDTFTYETTGENAAGRSSITFTLDPGGRATTMTIFHLNNFGNGVFRRVSESPNSGTRLSTAPSPVL